MEQCEELRKRRMPLNDIEDLKSRICFTLINPEKNMDLLKEVPYVLTMDIAMIFYLYVDRFDPTYINYINTDDLNNWHLDKKELEKLAFTNTPKLQPAVLEDIVTEMLCDPFSNIKDIEEISINQSEIPMYVLSNKNEELGAACMLYNGLLKEIADKENSDLIVMPSSIHECIITLDINKEFVDMLKKTVVETNESAVSAEDFLSNHVYRYKREMDKLEMV